MIMHTVNNIQDIFGHSIIEHILIVFSTMYAPSLYKMLQKGQFFINFLVFLKKIVKFLTKILLNLDFAV